MSSTQDEISPAYIRNKVFTITLNASNLIVRAFQPTLVSVDYSGAKVSGVFVGVMLPLILEVQGPSPESYQRRVFTHTAPGSLIFTPREGGRHNVVLREVAHNRWFGSLRIDVLGDPIRPLNVT